MRITLLTSATSTIIGHLTTLYVTTFSAPPRNETIDRNQIMALFKEEILQGDVRIIEDDQSTLLGSISVVPGERFKDAGAFDLPEGHYLSNFMVAESARNNGVGKKLLMDALTAYTQPINARCRADAYAVNHLFKKHQFILQATYTTTTNGASAERNIYTYFPKRAI